MDLARYKDPVATSAFAAHLRSDETLQSWAYGLKQPPMPVMLLLGPIAHALLKKEYLIGLTSQRVILLRVKGKKAEVVEVTDYELDRAHSVTVESLTSWDRVVIEDAARPFDATFNPLSAPDNLGRVHRIVAALKAPRPVAA